MEHGSSPPTDDSDPAAPGPANPLPPPLSTRQPAAALRARTGNDPASAAATRSAETTATPASTSFSLGAPPPPAGMPLPPPPAPSARSVFPDPLAPPHAYQPIERARDIQNVPPPPPRGRGVGLTLLLAAIAGIVGAGLALAGFLAFHDDPAQQVVAPPADIVQPVRTEIVGGSEDVVAVAPAVGRAVIPSIVTVEVDNDGGASFVASGSGSGVVLDLSGNIVTNDHVVAGARTVHVIFSDGRTYDAEIVGNDPRTDLAVIKIEASGLIPVRFGSSRDLSIGDAAIAVGSPLGLDGGPSLTVGVISAFDRRVRTGPNLQTDLLFGMIQTDAPITSGSSGGALVDQEGKLIGITSAIGVSNVGAEGIGFAIPVELVRRVTDELISDGQARHAFLGIGGETEFEQTADGATIPVGVRVQSIESGSAASAASLDVGDRIVSLDQMDVRTMDGLIVSLRDYRVGTRVDLVVERDGVLVTVEVTLGERDD